MKKKLIISILLVILTVFIGVTAYAQYYTDNYGNASTEEITGTVKSIEVWGYRHTMVGVVLDTSDGDVFVMLGEAEDLEEKDILLKEGDELTISKYFDNFPGPGFNNRPRGGNKGQNNPNFPNLEDYDKVILALEIEYKGESFEIEHPGGHGPRWDDED